jgi:nicotinamide-nucleotide amidase
MNKDLATLTLEACRARGEKVATAESCTGGLVSANLTAIAGSSDVVERGFVTYSNAAKVELLGVRTETLDAHGAVSEDVASEMAAGALAHSQADIAVSITGIAGPGGSDHKPEGRVCFGLATPDAVVTCTVEFGAIGREKVRKKAAKFALRALRDKQLD